MDDKMEEMVSDATDKSRMSYCCGASIVMEDICSRCKEHCSSLEEENNEISS